MQPCDICCNHSTPKRFSLKRSNFHLTNIWLIILATSWLKVHMKWKKECYLLPHTVFMQKLGRERLLNQSIALALNVRYLSRKLEPFVETAVSRFNKFPIVHLFTSYNPGLKQASGQSISQESLATVERFCGHPSPAAAFPLRCDFLL